MNIQGVLNVWLGSVYDRLFLRGAAGNQRDLQWICFVALFQLIKANVCFSVVQK